MFIRPQIDVQKMTPEQETLLKFDIQRLIDSNQGSISKSKLTVHLRASGWRGISRGHFLIGLVEQLGFKTKEGEHQWFDGQRSITVYKENDHVAHP